MTSSSSALTPNIYQADIFLDKPIFNPGDLVTGQVVLRLAKKLFCDTLSVQLFGSARVFFVQKTTKPGTLMASKAFEQEQVLIDQTQNIWMTNDRGIKKEMTLDEIVRNASSTAIKAPRNTVENPGIEHGNHTFAFSFSLPTGGLYTSFDARNSAGYIRYYILLKASNGSCVVLRKKSLFAVVCPKILLNSPLPVKDRVLTQRREFDKGAYLSVGLNIEKRVYVPGEPIKGCISIENRSGKSVKYALLYIYQETICYSTRPEIQIHESASTTAGIGLPEDKIKTGDDLTYPIKFNIPALLPNIDVPNCIQTNYQMRLDVGFERVRSTPKSVPISIKVPISIGTQLQTIREAFPCAPPSYEEIENQENLTGLYPMFPPDYSASTLGLSNTHDMDDSYTPLCYHYNFAFTPEDEKKNQ